MNAQQVVETWNRKFSPGQAVEVDSRELYAGRTITRAEMRNGVAMVFVDSMAGAVPLACVRPVAKGEERFC